MRGAYDSARTLKSEEPGITILWALVSDLIHLLHSAASTGVRRAAELGQFH